jgi:hypothetical protein
MCLSSANFALLKAENGTHASRREHEGMRLYARRARRLVISLLLFSATRPSRWAAADVPVTKLVE